MPPAGGVIVASSAVECDAEEAGVGTRPRVWARILAMTQIARRPLLARPRIARPLLSRLVLSLLLLLTCSTEALAWGQEGHAVTALVAYRHLTPAARSRLDALLASDADTLTAPDFASRAAWADAYRGRHRETALWHFVDLEIDNPDPASACFGFPPLGPGQVASAGPARDCVLNKIVEFEAELKDPTAPAPERLLALKFLIHFIGDIHQPLHGADHSDRGGNCVSILTSPDALPSNLHAFWDTQVVLRLGDNPEAIAEKLDGKISKQNLAGWSPKAGITRDEVLRWATESVEAAKTTAYDLPQRPDCAAHAAPELLPPQYQEKAEKVAALRLSQAGVRLASALNDALK